MATNSALLESEFRIDIHCPSEFRKKRFVENLSAKTVFRTGFSNCVQYIINRKIREENVIPILYLLDGDFMAFAPCHSNSRIKVVDLWCSECNCLQILFYLLIHLHLLNLGFNSWNLLFNPASELFDIVYLSSFIRQNTIGSVWGLTVQGASSSLAFHLYHCPEAFLSLLCPSQLLTHLSGPGEDKKYEKDFKKRRRQKHEFITCSRKPTFKSSIFSLSLVIWDSCDFDTLRWWLQIMATWVWEMAVQRH